MGLLRNTLAFLWISKYQVSRGFTLVIETLLYLVSKNHKIHGWYLFYSWWQGRYWKGVWKLICRKDKIFSVVPLDQGQSYELLHIGSTSLLVSSTGTVYYTLHQLKYFRYALMCIKCPSVINSRLWIYFFNGVKWKRLSNSIYLST